MNLDDVKRILELVKEHELSEFELEQDGLKIRVRKDPQGRYIAAPEISLPVLPHVAPAHQSGRPVPTTFGNPAPAPVAGSPAVADEDSQEFAVVKSPIVGTFYRAPEPAAPAFTDVGAHVKKGQVLCIIEAMKLMNEIESEYDGEVVKIYVENGQPVQYGERLFAIKAS
jgi:acetyl-CoA carboxylase biotin carboxyl carrier protein